MELTDSTFIAKTRLARNYAHQVLLFDEFTRAGVEVVFLNREVGQTPEDQQRARIQQRGACYLLQGLIVCACRGYANSGKPISPSARKGHERSYAYYRCIGSDAYRFGGLRWCWNKQLRTDLIDEAVWKEVCRLLEEPERLAQEWFFRRLDDVGYQHCH